MTTAELSARLESSRARTLASKAALEAFQAASRARIEVATVEAIASVSRASGVNEGLRAEVASVKGRLASVKASTRAIERGLAAEDRRIG